MLEGSYFNLNLIAPFVLIGFFLRMAVGWFRGAEECVYVRTYVYVLERNKPVEYDG